MLRNIPRRIILNTQNNAHFTSLKNIFCSIFSVYVKPLNFELTVILFKIFSRRNKKMFELFGLHQMFQELRRTIDPNHTFLCINLNSILLNLEFLRSSSFASNLSTGHQHQLSIKVLFCIIYTNYQHYEIWSWGFFTDLQKYIKQYCVIRCILCGVSLICHSFIKRKMENFVICQIAFFNIL